MQVFHALLTMMSHDSKCLSTVEQGRQLPQRSSGSHTAHVPDPMLYAVSKSIIQANKGASYPHRDGLSDHQVCLASGQSAFAVCDQEALNLAVSISVEYDGSSSQHSRALAQC